MALQVTKTIGGINITTYALITKFWHTKFEVSSRPTGNKIPMLDGDGKEMKDPLSNEVMMADEYENLQTVYVQIEYFKDRETAHEMKSMELPSVFMLVDFNPNLTTTSVLEQMYTLLKEQIPEFADATDILE